MTISFKQAKKQATQFADLAHALVADKTVKGGFLGMQDVELDWNGRQTALITFLWDVVQRLDGFAKYEEENAETIEIEEAAEAVRSATSVGIEMLQFVIQDVVDGFEENNVKLSISDEVIGAIRTHFDDVDDAGCNMETAVMAETAVLVAKHVAECMDASGFNQEADKMRAFKSFVRGMAGATIAITNKNFGEADEAPAAAPARKPRPAASARVMNNIKDFVA